MNAVFCLTKPALLTALLLTGTFVLSKTRPLNLNITHRQIIHDVPSASGVEISGSVMYVIGDNSPWLYELTESGELVDKFRIYESKGEEDTIPKAIKPDFEAMTLITQNREHTFYIFGSASKSPQRELLVKGTVDEPNHWAHYDLTSFFSSLRESCQLTASELNIEAAVATTDSMYLFNRGTNCIIQFSLAAFEDFIAKKNTTIAFKKTDMKLPEMNGIPLCFSGAALVPGRDMVIFTASAENTSNWIDDGEISGSYVGMFDLNNCTDFKCTPISEKGVVLPLKIESVAIKSATAHKMELIFVTDQDGGLSELIYADLLY